MAAAADADAGRRSSTSSTARSCAEARRGPSMSLTAALAATRRGRPLRRGRVQLEPHGLSLRRACRAGARRSPRPAASRSSATGAPTTSAARSIRCWSKARSSAAWRRASAARCCEEFLYDENGEPLSVTFADYLMPTAREVPPVDVLITEDAPSPLNPLGLKGAGEGGINRGRRGDRLGDRRCAAAAGRGHRAAGDPAAAQGLDAERLTIRPGPRPDACAPCAIPRSAA